MAAFVLGGAAIGHAQDDAPLDPAFNVQLFEHAIGPGSFLTVSDADIASKQQFNVDFLVTFLTNPFVIYNVNRALDEITSERTQVVQSVFAGDLSGAYGLSDRLQVGVSLPLIFSMRGEGINPATAMPSADGLQASGLGDIRAEVKTRLWASGRMRLAGAGGITLPTSFVASDSDFFGDNLPSARGRVAFQWSNPAGTINAGANLGLILRKPREVYGTEVAQQLTYGGAGSIEFNDNVAGIAEVFGRTGLFGFDVEQSPLEASGAVKVKATRSVTVLAGGGAGLLRGIGAPRLRMFISVGWAPDYRDTDRDGISNLRDQCPLVAEDRDNFEDDDGCPDHDNDGDKREDAIDECPMEREDLDGFEDDDGCPELDNDRDGIKDLDDRCPNHAEDGIGAFADDGCPASRTDADDDSITDDADRCPEDQEDLDGFEDWDGCPEPDNDSDGVPDESDRCPVCKEDVDGFEDEDGCPELDNDSDGIFDSVDQCPMEAEAINGVDDSDGCPDRGGRQLAYLDGDRVVFNRAIQIRRGRLRSGSVKTVEQAAAVMNRHAEVTKWLVVVAAPQQRTEEATRQRSQEWADLLKVNLLLNGVPGERIEAVGALSSQPLIAIKVSERASVSEDGTPVCPDSQIVTPREPAAAPDAAPASGIAPAAVGDDSDGASQPASAPAPDAAGPAADGVAPAADTATPAADTAAPAPDATGDAKALPPEIEPYRGVVAVKFRRNSATMRSSSRKTLDQVARLLAAHPHVRLEVGAHTDSRKGPEKSREITQAQADKVVEYLVGKGISADRLKAVGYGMDRPIGDNKRSKGRAENRRIELSFTVE